jgi:tetratricopeptide (TPR) repeat protein
LISLLKRVLGSLGVQAADDSALLAARAHYDAGRLDQARASCERLLAEHPAQAEACWLMGRIHGDLDDYAAAKRFFARAIDLDAAVAKYHHALGYAHQATNAFDQAVESYRRALRAEPRYAQSHNNLGCVMQMQGRLREAAEHFRAALQIDPTLAQANQNLGALSRDPGMLGAAAQAYRQAIVARPSDPSLHVDLGNTLREQGELAAAIASFDRAIELNPDHAEAHFSKGLVQLLAGDLASGWREYEWRWRRAAAAREFPMPRWDGTALPGGTILLHVEQGFGDTLQFVRYAPLVARRCARVVVECQPELKSLLETMPGIHQVVAQGEPLPPCDAQAPLLSIPGIFGTTLETIPASVPYLFPDAGKVRVWRERLAHDRGGFRLGLCWAGRAEQWDDFSRSCTLEALAPIGQIDGVALYSLQKGATGAERAADMELIDHTAELRDFSDTAALMANLDLVVTVDTSVAHLAGALGRPAWAMLSRMPDWRWLLERADCPWYPSMRLFRQKSAGDWSSVVREVAAELRSEAARA